MPFPQVVAIATSSPADLAGVVVGDEIRSMNGVAPRDVIEFHFLADEPVVSLELSRGGLELDLVVEKSAGASLGIEVSSPVFDRVRTCDNHCEFCFIYQLPKGMRRSLYVKDDDYRLSFLYGNFTTLTRFTELDLERVVTERLSPLYVSIHATDPDVRSRMLRNKRGAMSLRWLRALLDNGIEVHGQIVVCPGLNDGGVFHDTLAGILERFPDLASAAAVPLGVSRYSREEAMRPHTSEEAVAVVEAVEEWQERFLATTGRRLIHAADEYYLLAGRPLPSEAIYESFPQIENGIGMARAFESAFLGGASVKETHRGGFFAAIDGAPASGYRAPREHASDDTAVPVRLGARRAVRQIERATTVLTGEYGKRVLAPLIASAGYPHIDVVAVKNDFFGGNIGVAGLITGDDLSRALEDLPHDHRYLLPDVCLSEGRFLDGKTIDELPRVVEVVATDGASLRRALGPVPSTERGSLTCATAGTR